MGPGTLIFIAIVLMAAMGVAMFKVNKDRNSMTVKGVEESKNEEKEDKKKDSDHAYAWHYSREDKLYALAAYLGPLVFIPWFLKKDSDFCQFHVRQGKVLLAIEAGLFILSIIISPLATLLKLITILFLIGTLILGGINVWRERQQEIPGISLILKK